MKPDESSNPKPEALEKQSELVDVTDEELQEQLRAAESWAKRGREVAPRYSKAFLDALDALDDPKA